MKIEGSIEEFEQIVKEIRKTPVEVTTDVPLTKKQLEQVNQYLSKDY